MHIKNKRGDVSQVGSLGFIFLKVNAKYGYGRLQKKSHKLFLSCSPFAILLSRSGILVLYYLNLCWPCDLLQPIESGGSKAVSVLCLRFKRPGTHLTLPLGQGQHCVNNLYIVCQRMENHMEKVAQLSQGKLSLAQNTRTMQQNPA